MKNILNIAAKSNLVRESFLNSTSQYRDKQLILAHNGDLASFAFENLSKNLLNQPKIVDIQRIKIREIYSFCKSKTFKNLYYSYHILDHLTKEAYKLAPNTAILLPEIALKNNTHHTTTLSRPCGLPYLNSHIAEKNGLYQTLESFEVDLVRPFNNITEDDLLAYFKFNSIPLPDLVDKAPFQIFSNNLLNIDDSSIIDLVIKYCKSYPLTSHCIFQLRQEETNELTITDPKSLTSVIKILINWITGNVVHDCRLISSISESILTKNSIKKSWTICNTVIYQTHDDKIIVQREPFSQASAFGNTGIQSIGRVPILWDNRWWFYLENNIVPNVEYFVRPLNHWDIKEICLLMKCQKNSPHLSQNICNKFKSILRLPGKIRKTIPVIVKKENFGSECLVSIPSISLNFQSNMEPDLKINLFPIEKLENVLQRERRMKNEGRNKVDEQPNRFVFSFTHFRRLPPFLSARNSTINRQTFNIHGYYTDLSKALHDLSQMTIKTNISGNCVPLRVITGKDPGKFRTFLLDALHKNGIQFIHINDGCIDIIDREKFTKLSKAWIDFKKYL